MPHSSAVSLRYVNGGTSGPLDMHIVVPMDDRGTEKFEKNKSIVCLEEDLDTSLESANFSKIPRTGATVKVRL